MFYSISCVCSVYPVYQNLTDHDQFCFIYLILYILKSSRLFHLTNLSCYPIDPVRPISLDSLHVVILLFLQDFVWTLSCLPESINFRDKTLLQQLQLPCDFDRHFGACFGNYKVGGAWL